MAAVASACLVTLLGLAGCGSDGNEQVAVRSDPPGLAVAPPALALLTGSPSPFASRPDLWSVWVCDIPQDTTSDLYASDQWRLTEGPDELAEILGEQVSPWFLQLSNGAYEPGFETGGRVAVGSGDDGDACVAAALDEVDDEANGVLVVATAAHRSDAPGGWGRPGRCPFPCGEDSARSTGRAVYVGASDFDPSWSGRPPLDLIEHELGHALDLPHSGDPLPTGAGDVDRHLYTSDLDVMSNSAAARVADPRRRDAQGTIAANRIALGWLPSTDIAVVTAATSPVVLSPSSSTDGTRAAVVPLDDQRLLTVELLVPEGLDRHLPHAGVAVHLVDQSAVACGRTTEVCTGELRRQIPLVGSSPHTDLLTAGESIVAEGWTVSVISLDGDTCRVALTPP